MPHNNSHAPEIITHINEGHSKPNVFKEDGNQHDTNPKTDGHGKGPVNIGGESGKSYKK